MQVNPFVAAPCGKGEGGDCRIASWIVKRIKKVIPCYGSFLNCVISVDDCKPFLCAVRTRPVNNVKSRCVCRMHLGLLAGTLDMEYILYRYV